MALASLRALHSIISDGLNDIERIYEADGLDFPSLDSPADMDSRAEKLTSHDDVRNAIARIVSAADQIGKTVRPPFLTLCDASMGFHLPGSLRLFEAAHIAELLREAGPDGMHMTDIAHHVGTDSSTIGHVCRLLATHHMLREVRVDCFALNRISTMLDSGKSFDDLKNKRVFKYDDQGQKAALIAMDLDELFKAAPFLTEVSLPDAVVDDASVRAAPLANTKSASSAPSAVLELAKQGVQQLATFVYNPETGLQFTEKLLPAPAAPAAADPEETPELPMAAFNLSQRTSMPFWVWLEAPGNEERLKRFGCAMGGTQGWEELALEALGDDPFPELAPGSVVVDVGGGIGSASIRLSERFPELKFIVQDRAPVCKMGVEALKKRDASLAASGRVEFQAHDFFNPQPVQAPAVFLCRVVCHDWPDDFARRILLRLRRAAGPNTHLVLGDHILPYAVSGARDGEKDSEPQVEYEEIEGARDVQVLRGARWPLLSNLGAASANAYWMDLIMKTIFNGKERTFPEHVKLAASAGWRVVKVSGIGGSLFGHIIAVPTDIPADA